ncbi:MAG: hypothetical protein DCC71_17805 [Proteobacteria bacterium]|nr:MAG: hypothetical protein DCC71_17805 [Pseudomonadota bacterium]
MDVVCFGQQNWDFCWTGKQHLMTRLAARGHRVLYVDPDLALATRLRDVHRSLAPLASGLGLREAAQRCWVFTLPYSPALRWRLSVRRYPRVLRRAIRRLGFAAPICLTLYPRALPYADVVPFAARVHYAIDEMTAYGGLPAAEQRRVRAAEEALVRRADVALAISPRLHERLRRLHPRTHLLPSGADARHFAPERIEKQPVVAALAALARPIAGFVGQIDERLDQDLVVALARRGGSVVLVGRTKDGVDVSALDAEPNVHRLGYRPFAALPAVFGHFDVCIAPYRLGALTHASSPLKVYEYLASGRPVVVTPVEGLGECRDVVEVAEGADAFCAAVERCLAADARRAERLAVAARNGWDRRVDALERHLAEALAVAGER